MKKLLLATLGSFAFLLVVNAALFPVFFPDGPRERYVEGRSSPLVLYSVLAFLITAFLMSYLYPLISRDGPGWKEGLRVGVIMALFVSLPENLHVYALTNVSILKVFFPAVWVTVIWGLAGVVIGMIYGREPAKGKAINVAGSPVQRFDS
ncbi:MAG: hypothetical protein ABJA18_11490 [bacterium]